MEILNVKDLVVGVEEREILHGINLKINAGEVHVIMGPNGSGKSTLSNTLMGHPAYKVLSGEATFMGEDLFSMTVDERARKGMFLSFQYPEEVPGITNEYFLQKAKAQKEGTNVVSFGFRRELKKSMEELQLREDTLSRHLNVGFSGGEKKKNEILQMSVLEPKLAILDETDSGLDVDAIRVVYETIQKKTDDNNAVLLITHYSRILQYLQADVIHLLVKGRIVKTGGVELAELVDKEGYDSFL